MCCDVSRLHYRRRIYPWAASRRHRPYGLPPGSILPRFSTYDWSTFWGSLRDHITLPITYHPFPDIT